MKPFLYSRRVYGRGHCPNCDAERSISRRALNHRTFLILTVLTGGLWGVAWLSAWWGERWLVWRCRICRHAATPLVRKKNKRSNVTVLSPEAPLAAALPGSSFIPAPRIPRQFRQVAGQGS